MKPLYSRVVTEVHQSIPHPLSDVREFRTQSLRYSQENPVLSGLALLQ